MKVKFSEIRDSFLYWCIIRASVLKDKNVNHIWPEFDAENVDVKFIVNGVELPLIQAFEDMKQQDERRIKEAAMEYADERLSEVWDLIEIIKNTIHDKLGVDRGEEEL